LYNLTPQGYEALLEKQGHRCAICFVEGWETTWGTLRVDHDHATEEVRGLLCNACNQALGLFKDDPERLGRAMEYVRSPAAYVETYIAPLFGVA
jgi:hypothetical protein